MSKEILGQVLGWAATFLFSVALVPQIIKTAKTKTVVGVSGWEFIINLIANIIALCYAILITQGPLIIKYVIALVLTGAYLILYWAVDRKSKSPNPI